MLLVFTLRASVLSSWGHPDLLRNANTLAARDRGDTPVEMLVYVQSSPDIPVVRDAIDKVAAASGEGVHLPIVVDSKDDFAWPWAWYLRKYDNLTIKDIDKDYHAAAGQRGAGELAGQRVSQDRPVAVHGSDPIPSSLVVPDSDTPGSARPRYCASCSMPAPGRTGDAT